MCLGQPVLLRSVARTQQPSREPLLQYVREQAVVLRSVRSCQYLRHYQMPEVSTLDSVTSEQIRAGRMLLRWEQKDLALASRVSLPTIKRLETRPGVLSANPLTIDALTRAFFAAGIEFTNGDAPGVRFRKKR
jgi:hypothetical protein